MSPTKATGIELTKIGLEPVVMFPRDCLGLRVVQLVFLPSSLSLSIASGGCYPIFGGLERMGFVRNYLHD
jgi:hypothetical protein